MRDLLGDAVRRAKLSREMRSVRVVALANARIAELLPEGRDGDARALSLGDGTLVIGCLNGGAKRLLSRHAPAMLRALREEEPQAVVHRVAIRIVPGFDGDRMC